MSLNFCHIHGAHSGLYTCPRCEKEYLREQYDRENPGEYGCPHCRYITLRYRATRCPSCQGEVERYFWDDLDAREAAAANALGVAEATKRQYRLGLEAQYGAAIKKAVRRNTIFYVLYYLATVLLVFCSFMANINWLIGYSALVFVVSIRHIVKTTVFKQWIWDFSMPAMVYAAENALESEVKNYFLLLGMGGLCGAVPGAAIGLLISFFRGFDFGLVSLCAFLGFIFMYSLFLLLFFSFLMLFRLLKGVTLSLPSKISLTGRGEIGENTCNASLGYWDKVVMALIQGLVIFNGNPKIYFADGDQS